jgi:hypothetical protein
MQDKVCAIVVAQLCQCVGKVVPVRWQSCAIAVAQKYSFYSGKSLLIKKVVLQNENYSTD